MYYSVSFREALPWCTYFGRYRQRAPWDHQGKMNPMNLLVYVVDGQADFSFGGQVYTVGAGEWMFIPGCTYYEAKTDDFCDYYFFHFTGKLKECEHILGETGNRWGLGYTAEPSDDSHGFASPCYLSEYMSFAESSSSFAQLCAKMNHKLFTSQPEAEYEFQLIFMQILLDLSRCLRNKNESTEVTLINKIVYYINENITKQISLSDLADHFSISKSYVHLLFRNTFKTTVTEYIRGVKLEYAAQLLRTSNMNISEIADFLGYTEPSYFSRVFRKRYGQPPSKFE